MKQSLLLIGLGGGLGSISRYLMTLIVQKNFETNFPLATFVINLIGCLIIGVLLAYFSQQNVATNNKLSLLLVTGFCGGYTTFSTFAFESVSLFHSGNTTTAFLYIATSILSCLFAVWLGLSLTKLFL